jgi:hypothetical protein
VVKVLLGKRAMGVDINVLASEDNRADTAAARKALVDAGIPVYTSPGMHEKMIFIDNTITYLGSLNSLSHRSTTESMQRIVSGEVFLEWWKVLRVSERLIPVIRGQDLAIPFRELQKTSVGNCPECGALLKVRRDRNGGNAPFNGCSNFPLCRYIENVEANQLAMIPALKAFACDHCEAGTMGIHAVGKHLWLECAAEPPCGHRRKIVIQR